MSKVTMQDIADAVSVSRITVWKALSNRPGVSEELRRQIQHTAADLGYRPSETAPACGLQERTFSVVVSRPESSAFWMQIIHHIAKELALHGIKLMYTYMPTAYKQGYTLPSSRSPDSVDGLIVLNIYDERLLRMLTQQPLPKVYLDTVPAVPPDELNGDLVILEGRTRIRQITDRLLREGRKRLGFIGDVDYAQTNYDRYLGFLDAHSACHIQADPALNMTGPIGLRSHYEEISAFLGGLPALPDGFICASDFIAHYVWRYLSETGRSRPDGFVLTGFDNNVEYSNVAEQITTVDVETSMLGKDLARKLIYRTDYPKAPYEVSYIATKILYRGRLAEGR